MNTKQDRRTKLIVADEHTLGYIHPDAPASVSVLKTSVLKGGVFTTNQVYNVHISQYKNIRLASRVDFDNFNIHFEGYNMPSVYEFQSLTNSYYHNAQIIRTGVPNADFVVFNPGNTEFVEIEPEIEQIALPENDQFWAEIKSITWSMSCRFFLVVNESSIIIGNTLDNDAFCCQNLSSRFIETFVNHYSKK